MPCPNAEKVTESKMRPLAGHAVRTARLNNLAEKNCKNGEKKPPIQKN